MITEDYVSFETAKLLKEKGFEQIGCQKQYNTQGDLCVGYCYGPVAPTLEIAMKWFREVYKIHIIAEPCLGEGNEPNLSFNRWFWTILKEEGEYKPIRKIDEFPTYEQACEAAIKYCLEHLI